MSLQSFFKNLAAPLLALWPRLVFAGAILILGLGVATVAQKVVLRLLRRAAPEIRRFTGRLAYISVVIGATLGALAALVPYSARFLHIGQENSPQSTQRAQRFF